MQDSTQTALVIAVGSVLAGLAIFLLREDLARISMAGLVSEEIGRHINVRGLLSAFVAVVVISLVYIFFLIIRAAIRKHRETNLRKAY